MRTKTEPIRQRLATPVDARELRRFRAFADIRDVSGFVRTLNDLLTERQSAQTQFADELLDDMRSRAKAHEAETPWIPTATEVQRGRRIAIAEFNDAANLPVARYARLANRSRQQIYKDVKSGRLLAISLGGRGHRVPDWQLDPLKHRLTQTLMARVGRQVDAWTVFRFLQTPQAALGELTPLQAATPARIGEIVDLAVAEFGVQA